MPSIRVIAALGNPGANHASSRHNAGWILMDAYATAAGASWKVDNFYNAIVSEVSGPAGKILLIKPQTYMNLSGFAVSPMMQYYKLKTEELLVLHDDIAFEPGTVRLTQGGSGGGHNGVASVIEAVGEPFWRLRLGVGAKPVGWDLADWVLGNLTKPEIEGLKAKKWVEFVELIVAKGPTFAQNIINKV